MAERVHSALEKVLGIKVKSTLWANKNHNHAIKERSGYIHRKRATPAQKRERGIIPANMLHVTILVKHLGSPKFLHSRSHGAGRSLSRTQAKKTLSMKEFQEQMSGITGTVSPKTLDEAPNAYKPINEVMDAQKQSVKEIKRLIPIINWKG